MGRRFDELLKAINEKFLTLRDEISLDLSKEEIGTLAQEATKVAGAFYFGEFIAQENEIFKLKKELEKKS